MSAEEEEPESEPEEMDDEFDPFAEYGHDAEPQEGEEGDDTVHGEGKGGA